MNKIDSLSVLCFVEKGEFSGTLSACLAEAGIFKIHEAFDQPEALTIIKESDIDAIFIDDDVPHTDGIEFTKMLRTDEESPNQEIIIFLLSGDPNQARVIEAINSGVHELILKASMAKKLIARLVMNVTQPREFIRAPNYVGPDRRTGPAQKYKGPERREEDQESAAEAS